MIIWITHVLISHIVSDKLVAESEFSSAVQTEKEALLNTGWWNDRIPKNNSDHCGWAGITCNKAGSVTNISFNDKKIIQGQRELGLFNFSCFPNLKYLELQFNNLSGRIPSNIGDISKLNYLYLSYNNLIGEFNCDFASYLLNKSPY